MLVECDVRATQDEEHLRSPGDSPVIVADRTIGWQLGSTIAPEGHVVVTLGDAFEESDSIAVHWCQTADEGDWNVPCDLRQTIQYSRFEGERVLLSPDAFSLECGDEMRKR